MQDIILDSLKQVNATQLVAIAIMFWFFYSRLNEKFEKNKNEMKQEFVEAKQELKKEISDVKQELKQELSDVKHELKREISDVKQELTRSVDKLSEKVEDIDRRLCRIEGSLSTHGHCLFNQAQPDRKAE